MQEVRSKIKKVSRKRRREICCISTGTKTLLASVVILISGFMINGSGNLAFAQQVSIKLFDATPTLDTGPVTSPAEAIPFASKSLILSFAPGDTAVISSTPDGTGHIVIDNFMTINGVNVCEGKGGPGAEESCFGSFINPDQPIGKPIQKVLTPIPPVDVSSFIPVGTTAVVFELRDFGATAGNTNLFLVTTATITPGPPPPPTEARAFDGTVAICKNRLTSSALEIFGDAFEEQVINPILTGLQDVGADPSVIDQTLRLLNATKRDLNNILSESLQASLAGTNLLPPDIRRLTDELRQFSPVPGSVEQFQPEIANPQLMINQTIDDILMNGFDPTKVELLWDGIDATCNIGTQGGPPGAIYEVKLGASTEVKQPPGENKPKVTFNLNATWTPQSKKFEIKAEGTVATDNKGTEKSLKISVERKF